eukprot:TRINITY_DN3214_c2_g1_i1.p1 TRINITY_DN3214_c2_g1~~TRINITY_DN3214_c2_g1_i1.p1  ORF type:complete len:797 (+),score=221.86 TRINITY_DN3214_c2_g1_i1:43-2433(+)
MVKRERTSSGGAAGDAGTTSTSTPTADVDMTDGGDTRVNGILKKRLRLTLEPVVEPSIEFVNEQGEEFLSPVPTVAERFSALVRRVDFTNVIETSTRGKRTSKASSTASSSTNVGSGGRGGGGGGAGGVGIKMEEGGDASSPSVLSKQKEQQQENPWAALAGNMREAKMEVERFIDVIDLLQKKEFAETMTVQKHQSNTFNENAVLVNQKSDALAAASVLLLQSVSRIRHEVKRDRRFVRDLRRLSRNWKLRLLQVNLRRHYLIDYGLDTGVGTVPAEVELLKSESGGAMITLPPSLRDRCLAVQASSPPSLSSFSSKLLPTRAAAAATPTTASTATAQATATSTTTSTAAAEASAASTTTTTTTTTTASTRTASTPTAAAAAAPPPPTHPGPNHTHTSSTNNMTASQAFLLALETQAEHSRHSLGDGGVDMGESAMEAHIQLTNAQFSLFNLEAFTLLCESIRLPSEVLVNREGNRITMSGSDSLMMELTSLCETPPSVHANAGKPVAHRHSPSTSLLTPTRRHGNLLEIFLLILSRRAQKQRSLISRQTPASDSATQGTRTVCLRRTNCVRLLWNCHEHAAFRRRLEDVLDAFAPNIPSMSLHWHAHTMTPLESTADIVVSAKSSLLTQFTLRGCAFGKGSDTLNMTLVEFSDHVLHTLSTQLVFNLHKETISLNYKVSRHLTSLHVERFFHDDTPLILVVRPRDHCRVEVTLYKAVSDYQTTIFTEQNATLKQRLKIQWHALSSSTLDTTKLTYLLCAIESPLHVIREALRKNPNDRSYFAELSMDERDWIVV